MPVKRCRKGRRHDRRPDGPENEQAAGEGVALCIPAPVCAAVGVSALLVVSVSEHS